MNVLFLRPRIEVGGVRSFMATLAAGLTGRGCRCGVATAEEETPGYLTAHGVHVWPCPFYPSTGVNWLRAVRRLCGLVKEQRVDVLVSTHRFATLVGKVVSNWTGTPLVVTLHEFQNNWSVLAPLWTDKINVTPSLALKQHLVTHYGRQAASICVIPNGIDLDFQPKAATGATLRSELGLEPGALLVGCIARLSPEKGVRFLVESVPDLCQQVPAVHVIFVGDGPERCHIGPLAAQLAVSPHIHFLGQRADAQDLVGVMDVVVTPSLFEVFPLTPLEAMRGASNCGNRGRWADRDDRGWGDGPARTASIAPRVGAGGGAVTAGPCSS